MTRSPRGGGRRASASRATCSLIADRREAIEAAFERARPGDVVLLAGKGHEQSILYGDRTQPWDEAAAARDALAAALGFIALPDRLTQAT